MEFILATAAQQVVLQTAGIMHKVKSTIHQAQNNSRLSTELLRGDTVSKIFDFLTKSTSAKGLNLLISNKSDMYQTELSYFCKPNENI
jgi:aspartate 1-decarboxylase